MKCKYCSKNHENNNTGCVNSGNRNSGYYNSGDSNSGDRNSGNRNSGNYNSGYCNSGHSNSGDSNSGNYNSGNYNSGDSNSGYYNSGYCNSGHSNSGDRNSGNYNSGDSNSGYYNSGNRNSGYYNSGNRNSGWFNTDEPKMRFFNKDSDITYSEFLTGPWVFPDLKICSWVDYDNLSKDEQTSTAKQMGGLLKTLTYKEAWKEYWGRASASDKEWFKTLPNFDAKIFEEITGIKVEEENSLVGTEVEVKLNGRTYKAKITE